MTLKAIISPDDVSLEGRPPQAPAPWDHLFIEVGNEWFSVPPPKRTWLLRDRRKPNHDGVFPLGKAGQLIAEGGAGKTMALIQLAIAVATGGEWLETFTVPERGDVLMFLGEEDAEEAYRRIYAGARNSVQPRPGSIVIVPLHGHECAMLERTESNNTRETEFLKWARMRVKSRPWKLVIVDPLSRFAGPDAEKDNAAGTRFVQVIESLCDPNVTASLVAHHNNKDARVRGKKATSADGRGASALVDGFRWQANLSLQELELDDAEAQDRLGEIITFKVTKSNYAKKPDLLVLRRADGGPLVPLDSQDLDLVMDVDVQEKARLKKMANRIAESERLQKEKQARAEAERRDRDERERLAEQAQYKLEDVTALTIIRLAPGIMLNDLKIQMRAQLNGCSDKRTAVCTARLESRKAIRIVKGPNNSSAHYVVETNG